MELALTSSKMLGQEEGAEKSRVRAKHTGATARVGVRIGLLVNLVPREAMGAVGGSALIAKPEPLQG